MRSTITADRINTVVQEQTGLVLRLATAADVAALRELILLSVRGLSAHDYTPAQIESAIRYVFGVDTVLLADQTYYVAQTAESRLVGCGGWSRRETLYGGDQMKSASDPLLEPGRDAARLRAFFVHPDWARRGVAAWIMAACAKAAWEEGFRLLELVATLPAERLYRSFGFSVAERLQTLLPDGVLIEFVRMVRGLNGPVLCGERDPSLVFRISK